MIWRICVIRRINAFGRTAVMYIWRMCVIWKIHAFVFGKIGVIIRICVIWTYLCDLKDPSFRVRNDWCTIIRICMIWRVCVIWRIHVFEFGRIHVIRRNHVFGMIGVIISICVIWRVHVMSSRSEWLYDLKKPCVRKHWRNLMHLLWLLKDLCVRKDWWQCAPAVSCQSVVGGGGGCTPIYWLYGYVPLERAWYLSHLLWDRV